jgi:outer membrane lipoprotein-sorting protein
MEKLKATGFSRIVLPMAGFNRRMMRKRVLQIGRNRVIGALVFVAACSVVSAQSCDLTKTLAQMDTASAQFKSLQADFVWDEFQAVVQEDDDQSGTIYFVRHGGSTSVAANIQKPAVKKLTFDGSELIIYTPGPNEELIYSAAKNKDQVEGFLTLGFGGSGADLKKNWDVTCAGMETIAGTPTVKLALISKEDSVRNMFSKVTIWVDPTRAISLKQVFEQPSGDKRTNTFTNIKENAAINPGVFKIKTAPNPSITRK